jgi:hypothetical protein
MSIAYGVALDVCKRHADRWAWAMSQLSDKFPFTADVILALNDTELAVHTSFGYDVSQF